MKALRSRRACPELAEGTPAQPRWREGELL